MGADELGRRKRSPSSSTERDRSLHPPKRAAVAPSAHEQGRSRAAEHERTRAAIGGLFQSYQALCDATGGGDGTGAPQFKLLLQAAAGELLLRPPSPTRPCPPRGRP